MVSQQRLHQAAIDARRDWLVSVAETIFAGPELGFHEVATSRLVSEKLDELGIGHQSGIALTGIKGYLRGGGDGPTVAVIGELDSLKVPGHPNADPATGAAGGDVATVRTNGIIPYEFIQQTPMDLTERERTFTISLNPAEAR